MELKEPAVGLALHEQSDVGREEQLKGKHPHDPVLVFLRLGVLK